MSSLDYDKNKSRRFLALDAFRGFTLAAMILVNTPGSWANIYPPLKHANWHGATVTDFIFPFFLFIVGASIYFSIGKIAEQPYLKQCVKVGKRTILIFLIGVGLNWLPFEQSFENLRLMGVLQRIALAYFCASLLILFSKGKFLKTITVSILLAYWGILFFFGGSAPYSTSGNIAQVFDAFILTEQHMSTNFSLSRGLTTTFDPEGVLTTLPAIASVLIGYIAMVKMSEFKKYNHAIPTLLKYGILGVFCAILLHPYLPINKPLWTSSYVLLTSGAALLCLAAFIWLSTFNFSHKLLKPFEVYGLNPLFIYALSWVWVVILSRLLSIQTPEGNIMSFYHTFYLQILSYTSPMNASLIFAIAHVLLFYSVSFVLYKKNIIIKI